MAEVIFLGCASVGKTLVSRQIVHHLSAAKVTAGLGEAKAHSHSQRNSSGPAAALAPGARRKASTTSTGSKTQAPLNVMTTPTTGMQFESVRLDGGREDGKGGVVTLREVGYDMARLWHKYYKKADVLLYVVDASNRTQLAMASVELYRVLENSGVASKPLCILYNKIDQSQSMEVEVLRQYLHVAELRAAHGAPVYDCPVSALRGWNFDIVAEILQRCVK